MVVNKVYAIGGAKGGVGKTTTSINLGALLSAEGYSVATVEMDLAMPNFVDFLGIDLDDTDGTSIYDVLAGETPIEAAMYETDSGLTVVPSTTQLHDYDRTDLERLPQLIERLRWHHDVILIDTPAGRNAETRHALQVADSVLIVSTPRLASLRNARNTIELAKRNNADVRGLLLNKSGSGASPGIDQIAESLDIESLGHVPEDDAVPHAQDRGQPVMTYAPNSGAAIAYRKIARTLLDTTKTESGTENYSGIDQADEVDGTGDAESESAHEVSGPDDAPPEDTTSTDGPPVQKDAADDADVALVDRKPTEPRQSTTSGKAKAIIDKYAPKIMTNSTESATLEAAPSDSGARTDYPEEPDHGTTGSDESK